jgi:stearoyl-CoA desaturase (delta-9 desaturase)
LSNHVAASRKTFGQSIHWPYLLPILSVHVLALLALAPPLFSVSGLVLGLLGVHLFATLGINLCYHRLLTHRSFKTSKGTEHALATLALCCLQDTPIRWVATHRLHHTHADEEGDPHSPHAGLLWGHMTWLFRRNLALRSLSFYEKYAGDLLSDRYYFFLERRPMWALWIYMIHAALFAVAGALVGWVWHGTAQGAILLGLSWLVWGVFVRTVLTWHITWSVNSLTHLYGYRNYDTGEQSRNNWLVALIAAGEGWHNNHHWDPASATDQHRWWEWDLTYYVIWTMSRIGLARDIISPRHKRRASRPKARGTVAGRDSELEPTRP